MSIAGWDEARDEGCCYIGDDATACGVGRRPGSSYCEAHHALCHIANGSPEEAKARREVAALAKAVGGRQGDGAPWPPDRFLKKLERLTRRFS